MKSVTIDLVGPPCPRCERAMEVREHGRLRKKHLRQPYFYSRLQPCRLPDNARYATTVRCLEQKSGG